jgi:hypothetical protein
VGARSARLAAAGAAMALAGGLVAGPAHGFAIPVGGEFHVNSHTTDYQILPEVCGNDDGTFVVTWSSNYQDGYGFGVFGQRFDSDGSALGTEFQVNSTSPGYQFKPDSCCTNNGFVVVWGFQSDGDGGGIFGRRFDGTGTPLGTDFQVNSHTTGDQYYPNICCADNGDFIVVWEDQDGRDGDGSGVFGQRFDNAGSSAGTEFQVNSHTTDDQGAAVASCDADGNFVVTWVGGPTFNDTEIFARRFDASAVPQGGEFAVNSFTTDSQRYANVCHHANGDFVIVWAANGFQSVFSSAVVAKRYDSTGVAKEAEFAVTELGLGVGDPDVSCGDDGDFEVTYSGADPIPLFDVTTRMRQVDSTGTPLGSSVIASTTKLGYQNQSAIARAGGDGFVVVWRSTYQEAGNDYGGIYAQRFRTSATTTTTLPFGGFANPEGDEFQINTFTTSEQFGEQGSAVARASDGKFLVVWTTEGRQEGNAAIDGDAVVARLFEADGTPATSEFLVNTYTTRDQNEPVVTAAGDGFVIVWRGYAGASVGTGLFGRTVDGDGAFTSSNFIVDASTSGGGFNADVAGAADGSFVVVWEDDDASGDGLFGRRFDAAGAALGTVFQVNDYTTDDQRRAHVAQHTTGEFVVVWESEGDRDGDSLTIIGQRFDAAGAADGTEFLINTYTSSHQFNPSVDYDGAGNFVVVWDSSYTPFGYIYGSGLFGQRFGNDGSPLGTEFHVNSFLPGYQRAADVAADDDGQFMVVWQTDYIDGDRLGVAARLFDSTGVPLGNDLQVNTFTTDDQYLSQSVATDGKGNFVVVWTSDQQDGFRGGMFGQVFCTDLDADGVCDRIVCERTGVGSEQDISIKPKLVLSKINTDAAAGNDKLTFKGELQLPGSTSFGSLDPGGEGARLLLAATDGTVRSDDTLPAGAAWSTNGAGNRWSYKDKAGAVNGIIKMQIKDRSKKGPNQIQVIVKGKNGTYPIVAGDEPVQATVVFGDVSAGVASECGETAFSAADCKFNGAASKLSCKQ